MNSNKNINKLEFTEASENCVIRAGSATYVPTYVMLDIFFASNFNISAACFVSKIW